LIINEEDIPEFLEKLEAESLEILEEYDKKIESASDGAEKIALIEEVHSRIRGIQNQYINVVLDAWYGDQRSESENDSSDREI
jgi:hypothetical protein